MYNKEGTHTFLIRCECSINSTLSAIPFPLCWHMSRSLDGLCCMKPATESEVLILLVFLAPVPASFATDRTTSTRYVDIATSHESNSDLSNQLRRVRFFKESRESATPESLNDMPRPILRTALEERIVAEAKEEHKEQ